MYKNMKLEVKDIAGRDDIKLVKITGDLDVINAESFRKAIDAYITKGCLNLLFDLKDLRFIDSVGNLSLINIYMKAKREGGHVKIFGVNKNVKEVLDVIGVLKIIPMYESYEEALLSFKE